MKRKWIAVSFLCSALLMTACSGQSDSSYEDSTQTVSEFAVKTSSETTENEVNETTQYQKEEVGTTLSEPYKDKKTSSDTEKSAEKNTVQNSGVTTSESSYEQEKSNNASESNSNESEEISSPEQIIWEEEEISVPENRDVIPADSDNKNVTEAENVEEETVPVVTEKVIELPFVPAN